MASVDWQVSGDYFESCSCDFLCPCITSNMAAKPSKGSCQFAVVMHDTQGRYGGGPLDGLTFIVGAHTPGPMVEGNWTVGLIIDERASAEQADALTAIASGQAGGPMAALGGLIGTFAGVEKRPIELKREGMSYSVSVPEMLDQAIEGVASPVKPDEPLYIDNTLHPANSRLGLAKATRSHFHAFGIDWDDTSGRNNGHFAPFDWKAA